MKILAAIFISWFSITPKTIDPVKTSVYGVWKGYYGTENEIREIIIRIDPQNKAEVFCNFSDACLKTNGTYKLIGDSAIIISCLLTESKSSEVILYGNLNRTASFIDGQWDGTGEGKGCFYLQKQPLRVDL